MNHFSRILGLALAGPLLLCFSAPETPPPDTAREVEGTLRRYFEAMGTRDVPALRSVLDQRFVAIEADREKARTEVVDTSDPKALLPPEGNDDWDASTLRLSNFRVEVSATHPSVATASFTLSFLLDDERVAQLRKTLDEHAAGLGETEKAALTRMAADRAVANAMFALLAKRDGRWRIVCLSFPK